MKELHLTWICNGTPVCCWNAVYTEYRLLKWNSMQYEMIIIKELEIKIVILVNMITKNVFNLGSQIK